MNKTIVAFGASNSKKSINRKFAAYAASEVQRSEPNLLDLNDFEMPIYSIDRELDTGIPEQAYQFKKFIENSDGVVISFAEHNGSYSVAFKNILDWVSRIDKNIWANKPMLLLATSPGGRGGRTVLEHAVASFSRMNTNIILSYSLPSFHKNFMGNSGITDAQLKSLFEEQVIQFSQAVFSVN